MIYAWWLPQPTINKQVAKQVKASNSLLRAECKAIANKIAGDAIEKLKKDEQ